jgi:hypothetical protein
MPSLDVDTLARQVASVFTVGLGRYPRRGENIDQLLLVAGELSEDRSYPAVRLIEEALLRSVSRLGGGVLAELARLELRLVDSTSKMRYFGQRQEKACEELGVGLFALKRLEQELHLAIATDLLARLEMRKQSMPDNRRTGEADVLPH